MWLRAVVGCCTGDDDADVDDDLACLARVRDHLRCQHNRVESDMKRQLLHDILVRVRLTASTSNTLVGAYWRYGTVRGRRQDETPAVDCYKCKLEVHSVERMYLRQRCSDGSRWIKPF